MGRTNPRYTKDRLIERLRDEDPDVLAALPDKEVFTFEERNGETYLRIATYREYGNWLEVHFAEDYGTRLIFTCHSTWWYWKSDEFYKYGISWLEPFSKLDREVQRYPWDDEMRAFVLFAFTWAGKRDEFIDFRGGEGLAALVRVLQKFLKQAQEQDVGKIEQQEEIQYVEGFGVGNVQEQQPDGSPDSTPKEMKMTDPGADAAGGTFGYFERTPADGMEGMKHEIAGNPRL